MRELFPRYTIGFLCGAIFGLMYPKLISPWQLTLCLAVVFIINEIVGSWGFGSHWKEYRFSSYLLYSGVAACIWIGILLGSGRVGKILIIIGASIS